MKELPILKITNLNKHYGDLHIIKNASMTIYRGGIYGFVGQNGSGKTTVIRLIMGLAFADEAHSIELFNKTDEKGLSEARSKIDGVIENPYYYPNFTARQNLVMKCKFLGIKNYKQKITDLLKLVKLDTTGKKKVKNFSLGMKQRLAIAVSLINAPEFLILDEPTNGLDPAGIKEIRELMLKLSNEHNITILVSSHLLAELRKVATNYIVIRDGKIVDKFKADELDSRFEKELLLECENCSKAIKILLEEGLTIFKEEKNFFACSPPKKVGDLNKKLVENGVIVNSIRLKNKDAEGYFMELLGGGKNV
jgi:ABC-2 type transport system ATP-binding protein